MSDFKIQSLIGCLGEEFISLVGRQVIPARALKELYPGRDVLSMNLEPGLGLSFWAETMRLETIFITLIKTIPATAVYQGELFQPYTFDMSQAVVRSLQGEPFQHKGAVQLPEPIGWKGGWDDYRMDENLYPNTKVQFQYTADLKVNTLVFTLIDKGHD